MLFFEMNRISIFLLAMFLVVEASAWQAARRSQGRRQVEIRLIDQQISVANQSSYSFTVDIPPASEDRVLFVAVYGLRNENWRTLSSLTVNGTAIAGSYGLGFPMYFRYLKDSTLTGSQTFVATYSANLDRSGIAVYEVYGWEPKDPPENKYQNEAAGNKTYNWASLPQGSKVVCLAYNTKPNDIVWTNAEESYDITMEASDQVSVGIKNVTTTGAQSFTVASSGGAYSIAFVLRSE